MTPRVAIVVPCYNEAAVLGTTAARLGDLLGRLRTAGQVAVGSAIVFVDDGSSDDTWALISGLAATHADIAGLRLSRNRGHQNALLAGLCAAPGDALISVDADLQDDVDVIPQMLAAFASGIDIVYGVRRQRAGDSWFKRASARAYYRLLAALGVEVVLDHADFRLLSRRALEALREYREVNLFLRGLIPQLGYRSATIEYDRAPRAAGSSKYPLRRMLSLAWQGVTSFSAYPLRLITGFGFVVSCASIALAVWALAIRLFTERALPGWASTVIPMYFLGGVQLLSLGIIGEYLAKTYHEAKHRPRYHIEEQRGAALETPHADSPIHKN
jgi:glycosyltransferase involved in cell wall biosynthesis